MHNTDLGADESVGRREQRDGDAFKVLLFVVLVIIVLMAGLFTIARLNWDIAEPDLSDLAVTRHELPPEHNAFTYFNSASEAVKWPEDDAALADYLNGAAVDDTIVQQAITDNQDAMALVRQGVECQECLSPEVTLASAPLNLWQWQHVAQVMALSARRNRLEGNLDEATTTCIELIRYGDMIQRAPGSLIIYFTGLGAMALGLEQARDIALDQHHAAENLHRLAAALSALTPPENGQIYTLKMECQLAVNVIAELSSGKSRYRFNPNRTKLMLADHYRHAIANTMRPYDKIEPYVAGPEMPRNAMNRWMLMARRNAGGIYFYLLWMPEVKVFENAYQVKCQLAATRLVVALNLYHRQEGKLPDHLQDIVPEYLPAVPDDPYDGHPFRYSAERGVVYSVGKALKDNEGSLSLPPGNGSPPASYKQSDDLTFPISRRL
jgi:hypothetical protein